MYPQHLQEWYASWNGEGITIFLGKIGCTRKRVYNSAIAQLTHEVHYMNRLPTAREYMVILLDDLRITLNKRRTQAESYTIGLGNTYVPFLSTTNGHFLLSSKYDCTVL